ncbi:hypothetical protein P7K49_002266 [Saguinus oedipus]|uniref:Uncharacterized protein n=1 Tax=Saguinus oedipus TaxID=9490 RepID=A0ABQ9WHF0_SAGOE|nr:hypothetical protein P7K49_002266 [Saguinus oedipus]
MFVLCGPNHGRPASIILPGKRTKLSSPQRLATTRAMRTLHLQVLCSESRSTECSVSLKTCNAAPRGHSSSEHSPRELHKCGTKAEQGLRQAQPPYWASATPSALHPPSQAALTVDAPTQLRALSLMAHTSLMTPWKPRPDPERTSSLGWREAWTIAGSAPPSGSHGGSMQESQEPHQSSSRELQAGDEQAGGGPGLAVCGRGRRGGPGLAVCVLEDAMEGLG